MQVETGRFEKMSQEGHDDDHGVLEGGCAA